jgi:2-dehydro-3-deoxyphosphogluconate aldolase/(4S)-4-hydroxy-2-oxoglutarate aldolase
LPGIEVDMKRILEQALVVPVVVIDDARKAVPVARALYAGGLSVIEVTLRTAAAHDAIAAIAENVPEVVIGAGTVLSSDQAKLIVSAGASFMVSPGLHDDVVAAGDALAVPVIPGVATATEAQRAWNMGLRILKFFPAGLAGGLPMIKALSAVFGGVQFMPTGGVSTSNLGEYLAAKSVIACGGSWLTPADAIEMQDYERITALALEASEIARRVRG